MVSNYGLQSPSLTRTSVVSPLPPCHPSACGLSEPLPQWHPSACLSVFHVFEVRACAAPLISTAVEISTRWLSVVLSGLCVPLSARKVQVVKFQWSRAIYSAVVLGDHPENSTIVGDTLVRVQADDVACTDKFDFSTALPQSNEFLLCDLHVLLMTP